MSLFETFQPKFAICAGKNGLPPMLPKNWKPTLKAPAKNTFKLKSSLFDFMKLRILGIFGLFVGFTFLIIGCPANNNPTTPPPAASTPTNTPTPIPGYSWTPGTLPSSQNWTSVTYGNGMFVAVCVSSSSSPSSVAATSPDGITWTGQTLPSLQLWDSVTYGNGVFVAVATGSAVAATSPDGITWTARTLPSS